MTDTANSRANNLRRLNLSLDANAGAYRRIVQSSVPGDCWDFVILTAANEKQARGYRQELALRHRAVGPTPAFFPAIQRSVVVADPPGPRIGSGGATLGAMRALAEQYNLGPGDWDHLRILLIHSGGMSQRLPAYSSLGKIFAPLPLLRPDGQIATLFDHLYLTLAGLPERLGPGMLVMAGDVFLLFDHRHVMAPRPGVTALTMRVDAELGRGHGVFVQKADGQIQTTLQKVSVETMRDRGATDANDRVLIDTGLLFFDAPRTRLLATMAGLPEKEPKDPKRKGRKKLGVDQRFHRQLDLYEDMTAALAVGTQRAEFLTDPATRALRAQVWKDLHGIPFSAMILDGEFLHLGTTAQFRDAMIGRNPSPAADLFQQNVLARSDWHLEAGRRVYHSVLLADGAEDGLLGAGSVVEHSILRAPSRIGAGSVVSQVLAESTPINLRDNLLLFQVPVRDGDDKLLFVQAACGVEDDFKGKYADGKCLYFNEPIDSWLDRQHLSPKDIWPTTPADQRSLWNAQVFAATRRRDSADAALMLAGKSPASKSDVNAWKKLPRFSMAMVLQSVDPMALIEHREVVSAYLQASQMLEFVRSRQPSPVEAVIGRYDMPAAYDAAMRLMTGWATKTPEDASIAIDQARALWCCLQLLQRPDHPDPSARTRMDATAQLAFAKIAQASEMGHAKIVVGDSSQKHFPRGIEIVASAPVRLDLAGGWTDTPPYCFEAGGHVINLAVDLDGHPPIRATVRTLDEPKIILESTDLGRRTELQPGDLLEKIDVHDPFALHKVALGITNILPKTYGRAWRMADLGAGLHLKTECRVPKGSGLGTSSILAAAVLGALHDLRGKRATTPQIIEQTLLLEQRLGTGGGWQDQIGGIVGGLKSTVTGPGVPQKLLVESLEMSDARYEQLEQRMVVYFSGQQRLARDILRRVMGRWLAREPAVVLLMERLKQSAWALRKSLVAGNWVASAREIIRYWHTKKELYPGSTTPSIDVLMLELRHLYLAGGLAGAGGGGFGYFLCKDARQAALLRQVLAERLTRPGSLGAVYQMTINRKGLSVKRNHL